MWVWTHARWRGGVTCGQDMDSKRMRCREAGCPLSDGNDPRCAICTGPVAWKDAKGNRQGRARSCSGCPMDGMGLPVCWAACPGPNDGFSTDGMSMVTLGGMAGQEGADAYLNARMAMEARLARDSEKDGGGSASAGGKLKGFAAGLLRLDSRGFAALKEACARKDAKAAASLMGVPMGMFRGPDGKWEGSAADMVMARVGRIDGQTWEKVRGILSGRSQQDVARMSLVTKQAVNKTLRAKARQEDWIARILED